VSKTTQIEISTPHVSVVTPQDYFFANRGMVAVASIFGEISYIVSWLWGKNFSAFFQFNYALSAKGIWPGMRRLCKWDPYIVFFAFRLVAL
jgi:hypothetical protein